MVVVLRSRPGLSAGASYVFEDCTGVTIVARGLALQSKVGVFKRYLVIGSRPAAAIREAPRRTDLRVPGQLRVWRVADQSDQSVLSSQPKRPFRAAGGCLVFAMKTLKVTPEASSWRWAHSCQHP